MVAYVKKLLIVIEVLFYIHYTMVVMFISLSVLNPCKKAYLC